MIDRIENVIIESGNFFNAKKYKNISDVNDKMKTTVTSMTESFQSAKHQYSAVKHRLHVIF